MCFTPEAEAPPKGKFAVFVVFSTDDTSDAHVGASVNPESARYQLIKKAQRGDRSTPEFIAAMVNRGDYPLPFVDSVRYPRASRILAVVEADERSQAKKDAIRQLEREGWKVR